MKTLSIISQPRRRATGFTLFELVVVVIVVAIMLAIVLDRMLFYVEMAEKVAMQQTVGSIRSSLHLQTASLIAKNRANELPNFAQQNPMDWLAEKPANYVGEIDDSSRKNVASGSWFFDVKAKNLVYLVHNGKHFRSGNVEPNQVMFRVKLLLGKADPTRPDEVFVEGVVLEQVNAYSWSR